MGGTKYSRNTRNKNTLHTSIQNSPRYGNKACNLCERGRYPDDLSFKVSKYKTCADVHLELSLIDPSTATCAAGQEAYRELCCPTSRFELPSMKFPAVSIAAGLFFFWIFTRRIRQVRNSPVNDDEPDDDHNGNDEEAAEEKKYQRMMDDQSNGSKRRKRSKSRERNAQQRGRSKSRERNLQRSRSKESKWSKSTSASKSTVTAKGSHEDAVPEMVNMTFVNAKKGKNKQHYTARPGGASNVLQQQQRRLQQQYYGGATNRNAGATRQIQEQESEDAYYHLDDDTDYGESTLGGHDTVAGDSIQAVITQLL